MATDRWSLRNIYLYLVCLITLIMIIFGTVGVVRNVVELIYPEPPYVDYPTVKEPGVEQPTAEELEEVRKAEQDRQLRYAIIELVGNAALLLVAGPLYIYHWRKIETEHAPSGKTTSEE